MARWSDEKTIQFIRLYRSNVCLWNVRSPFYKNKQARENCYENILTSMKDNNLNIKIIKTKIKNLRSVYHTELKKVKDSKRSGAQGSAVYKPTLPWFNEMNLFLGDSFEHVDNEIKPPAKVTKEEDIHTPAVLEEHEPVSNVDYSTSTGPIPNKKRVRCHVNVNDLAEKQVAKAFTTLNNALNKERQEDDECDLFGKLLAKKLRKLPDRERELFMFDIEKMYVDRIQRLFDNPQNSRPSSSSS